MSSLRSREIRRLLDLGNPAANADAQASTNAATSAILAEIRVLGLDAPQGRLKVWLDHRDPQVIDAMVNMGERVQGLGLTIHRDLLRELVAAALIAELRRIEREGILSTPWYWNLRELDARLRLCLVRCWSCEMDLLTSAQERRLGNWIRTLDPRTLRRVVKQTPGPQVVCRIAEHARHLDRDLLLELIKHPITLSLLSHRRNARNQDLYAIIEAALALLPYPDRWPCEWQIAGGSSAVRYALDVLVRRRLRGKQVWPDMTDIHEEFTARLSKALAACVRVIPPAPLRDARSRTVEELLSLVTWQRRADVACQFAEVPGTMAGRWISDVVSRKDLPRRVVLAMARDVRRLTHLETLLDRIDADQEVVETLLLRHEDWIAAELALRGGIGQERAWGTLVANLLERRANEDDDVSWPDPDRTGRFPPGFLSGIARLGRDDPEMLLSVIADWDLTPDEAETVLAARPAEELYTDWLRHHPWRLLAGDSIDTQHLPLRLARKISRLRSPRGLRHLVRRRARGGHVDALDLVVWAPARWLTGLGHAVFVPLLRHGDNSVRQRAMFEALPRIP